MKNLLFGLLIVAMSSTAVVAQDAKDDEKENKNRVVTPVKEGAKPTYNLTQKYAPGKYRVSMDVNYSVVITEPGKDGKAEIVSIQNVFTVDASAADEKGVQTLKIYFDEIVMVSTAQKEIRISRNKTTAAVIKSDDKAETDADDEDDSDAEGNISQKLEKIIHGDPAIVKLNAAGKVISTENKPDISAPVCNIEEIYEDIEESHSYPQIGVGGSFIEEEDQDIEDLTKLRLKSVIKLDKVETQNGQTIGYFSSTDSGKNIPSTKSDDEDADAAPSSATASGTNVMVQNLTTGFIINDKADGVLNITIDTPQGQLKIEMNVKAEAKTEPVK